MSIQSEIERIDNNVQTTLSTIAETGVEVGTNSDALPAAAAALANEKLNKVIGTTQSGKILFVDETGTVSYLTLGEGLTITDLVLAATGGGSGGGSYEVLSVEEIREICGYVEPWTGYLPKGYTQLEYIQSSGAQYIDTGFNPTYQSRVVMDISGLGTSAGFLFGSRDASSSTAANQFVLYRNAATTIRADYFGTNTKLSISDASGRTTVDMNANVVSLFGETITNTAVASGACSYPMYLFTTNNAGAVHTTYAGYKMYSCQIYDNGTLIRQYVPCINPTGEVGLYDRVGDKFYGNAGTGTFTAGPAVNLPEGYTLLEFIQSSGTQYIDTGFVPNQDTRVVCDAEFAATSSGKVLFGQRTSTSSNRYEFMSNASKFYSAYNTSANTAFTLSDSRILIDKNKNVTSVNGAEVGTATYDAFQATYSIYLFACHSSSVAGQSSAKIYSCQIYDNGALVRKFVPCVNADGEVGLYDLVNRQFHGDVADIGFLAGPSLVEVECIESSGTQYIDTGFKPNQDTRVVMDFHNSGDYSGMATSLCPFFGARNASSSAVFALWIGTKTFPHYGNVAYNKNGNFTTDLNRRLTYDFNKNVVSIDGDSITCASATFTTSYDLCVLTINNYGTIESRRASGKLYSCQIYDNGTLVRDYAPYLRSDGIYGLYDKVHNKFYTNAGTGAFTGAAAA